MTVRVSIVDDTRRRDCDAGCGTDWASEEAQGIARRLLRDRFGAGASLEYVNLAETDDPAMQRWLDMITARGTQVPLLLINGNLRIAGQFDTRRVMEAVEAELEVGR